MIVLQNPKEVSASVRLESRDERRERKVFRISVSDYIMLVGTMGFEHRCLNLHPCVSLA